VGGGGVVGGWLWVGVGRPERNKSMPTGWVTSVCRGHDPVAEDRTVRPRTVSPKRKKKAILADSVVRKVSSYPRVSGQVLLAEQQLAKSGRPSPACCGS